MAQETPKRSLLSRAGGTKILAMVAVLIGTYMVSQFFRNSLGVIGPDLAREFKLEASHLSLLASVFFLSFALVQIPLGMAIDRYGPKICILIPTAILLAGTLLFAFARTYGELVAARLVIGLGCSSFLMGPLTIYAEKFSPQFFGTMVGFHVGAGNLGALAATAPLAAIAGWAGWRAGFLIVGGLVLAAFLLILLLVHDDDSAKQRRKERAESVSSLFSGVFAATRVTSFWPIFVMQMAAYPAFATILGLWAGPWLSQVYGYELAARGNLMFFLAVAQIGALFAWGTADRIFGSYKIPCMIGSTLCACVFAIGGIFQIPAAWLPAYLILMGLVFGFSPTLTSHGKSLFPPELIGRGLSILNIAAMGGVFVQQILTGFIIGLFDSKLVDSVHVYPPEAYRCVFAVLAAEIALATLLYTRTRDPHPSKTV